jgi:hypothetical protein
MTTWTPAPARAPRHAGAPVQGYDYECRCQVPALFTSVLTSRARCAQCGGFPTSTPRHAAVPNLVLTGATR